MKDGEGPLILDTFTLCRYVQLYDYSGEPLLGDTELGFPHAGDSIRARGYLLPQELYAIARWKSPRRAELIRHNPAQEIHRLTAEALALKDTDPGGAATLLDGLQGIGIPTASAVLTVVDPRNFGIVDVRVWKTLHRWRPNRFSSEHGSYWPVGDFERYLETIRELARANGLSCREVDMALWQMDREKSLRNRKPCSSKP